MNILYYAPDRINLTFSFGEYALPYILTDSFKANHRNPNYIRQFARSKFGAKEVFKNGTVWYKVPNLLFRYRPKNISFVFEITPTRIAAENLEQNGFYSIQTGLDLNSNFIDTEFLKGISNDQIENCIYQALEQGKGEALSIVLDFLKKGFKINSEFLKPECRFKQVEFACDIRTSNPDALIKSMEEPLVANFGDTSSYGTKKTCSITVFKRKRNAGIRELGKETRILYQKSPSIVRFERVFESKEIGAEDILLFNGQMLQSFFLPIKQIVRNELEELRKQAESSKCENIDSYKTALVLWLWKQMSQIRIPNEKFYLFEKAIETGQLDTSLLCDPYLKSRLLESEAFVPVLESTGMKRHRYLRINLEKFRNCLAFPT